MRIAMPRIRWGWLVGLVLVLIVVAAVGSDYGYVATLTASGLTGALWPKVIRLPE